jgi:hypothetical protein
MLLNGIVGEGFDSKGNKIVKVTMKAVDIVQLNQVLKQDKNSVTYSISDRQLIPMRVAVDLAIKGVCTYKMRSVHEASVFPKGTLSFLQGNKLVPYGGQTKKVVQTTTVDFLDGKPITTNGFDTRDQPFSNIFFFGSDQIKLLQIRQDFEATKIDNKWKTEKGKIRWNKIHGKVNFRKNLDRDYP